MKLLRFVGRHGFGTAFVVIALWLIVVGALVWSAYGNVQDARSQLDTLTASADKSSLQSGTFETDLATATSSARSAHWKLANPLVAPFRLAPFAGRQLKSAIALTGSIATAGDVASDALSQSRGITDKLKTDRAGSLASLSKIARDAQTRLAKLSYGPDTNLVGPLADARAQVSTELIKAQTSLKQASAAAGAMAYLLQNNSNYLLIASNNGEMRAGSGMFLSAGLLTTAGGGLQVSSLETVGTITAPAGSVTWPTDMQDRWGWIGGQNDLRNLMMSPRFDQSAPLAAQIWEAGHKDVDGVMVIDPLLLQAILKATGPVGSGDTEITADNVVQQLLIDQYRSINLSQSTVAAQAARRDGLANVAGSVFGALNSGDWDPVTMARGLSSAANGRHLLVWAKDSKQNQQWLDAGVGGTLSTDSLMLNSINVGANKLDQFIDTKAVVDQRIAAGGIDTTVTVTMTNKALSSAPGYVLGPTPGLGLARGEYSGLLTFSLPRDSHDVRFDGKPALVALGADGPNQTIGTRITINQNKTLTMTLRYTRAATAQYTQVEASGRYPATHWQAGATTWDDSASHRLSINSDQ